MQPLHLNVSLMIKFIADEYLWHFTTIREKVGGKGKDWKGKAGKAKAGKAKSKPIGRY